MLKGLAVLRLDRRELLVVGGLLGLLLVCASVVAVALFGRAEAWSGLAERREQLKGLEARTRSLADGHRVARISAAPGRAFLDAPTSGLATAQLQAYLAQAVSDQHAVLISSGVPATDRNDKSDAIRLQVALNATLPALQALLYKLESGVPYVFVDALSIHEAGSSERISAAADPLLKVNLDLHAFWQRKTT